jgi:hypothetical protein
MKYISGDGRDQSISRIERFASSIIIHYFDEIEIMVKERRHPIRPKSSFILRLIHCSVKTASTIRFEACKGTCETPEEACYEGGDSE